MTVENISRRGMFWLAVAAIAAPAATIALSDAHAQSDQTPATDTTAPKKKSKTTKAKTKTKPATDPASAPAATPK